MRVPVEWLREYCDPDLDVRAIEERLTMTGTKVEAIHHHGVRDAERFVVGFVRGCERHPDADRLSVCAVDLGPAAPDGPATIVCGAANVAAGQTVAVALPGATMPDGAKIKRAKLRGVVSEGMILAERELAIDSSPPTREGILVLDELLADGQLAPAAIDAAARAGGLAAGELPTPGTPLAQVLPLGGEVLELEITPNRPDCLGVYGVARELHAATGARLAPAPWQEDLGSDGPLRNAGDGVAPAEVRVDCPDLCPRFTARVFENVTLAQSPPWLKARLSAAGQRPINNVVDVTNYVMLLTAQPLHAFDLDRVAGARLLVRRARDGEQVQTLDGQTRTLDGQMVVIDDADGPTSIAGLMGGARSEVGEGTTRVLLEVATWNGPNIHRTGWTLGLRSEASARFEKGLAPEQCDYAQALATRLMIDLCGATVVPGTIDVRSPAARVIEAPRVRLRESRVQAILGVPIPRARQREILRALDFHTSDADDGIDVVVPPLRRADVTREADLIEEVARIDGVEKLPATLPRGRPAGRLSREQRLRRRAVDALVGRGLYETVGWTFTSPATLARLRLAPEDPRRAGAVALENPLSEEHALLRTTLLGSLLDSAAHNAARGQGDLGLFEVGTVFAAAAPVAGARSEGSVDDPAARAYARARRGPRETGVHEHRALGVLLAGRVAPPTWQRPDPPRADLYAVKGVLEALGDALRVPIDCRPLAVAVPGEAAGHTHEEARSHPFLHPGRAAEVFAGEQPIGWLGELHPLVAGWELDGAAVAELDLDRLILAAEGGAEARRYSDLISFPALRQDIAVILPVEVPAAAVLAVVREAGGKLLHEARVFDVYSGPQVGEGRRSLALALAYRAPDRTLADEDVAPVHERILSAVRERLGGELRG
jgi:phenylalanyl-tRNA synthetase beta chain